MYEFITGPLLWITFIIFGAGCLARVIWYIKGLDWKLDRVAYRAFPVQGMKGALRSIGYWLLPFGTHSWREQKFMTILFFVFHIGLVVTPIFLTGHIVVLAQRFGISWPTLPAVLADILTVGVIVSGILLAMRRFALPEVRIVTTAYDYLLLVITVAPFVTGLFASLHSGGDNTWLMLHILTGELMLVAIPLTKLSHFVLFFCSRGQLGADYAIKRGGMRGKPIIW